MTCARGHSPLVMRRTPDRHYMCVLCGNFVTRDKVPREAAIEAAETGVKRDLSILKARFRNDHNRTEVYTK